MGSDQLGQIKNIIDVLGYPEDADEEFEFIQIDRSRDFIKGLEKKEGKMKKMIEDSNINPLAGDLLLKMLRFNPNKRISVQETDEEEETESEHADEEEEKGQQKPRPNLTRDILMKAVSFLFVKV